MSGAPLSSSSWAYYCEACIGSLETRDPDLCPHCGARRPLTNWAEIAGSAYAHLGQCVDGRYRLDRFLGAGTSGQVYRARAIRIHRSFAMKIVDTRRYGKPEYQKEMMRRFEREVEAMSRLRNPHVVNIYETLQLPEQTFALVMDYVEGVTLQDMLDRVGRIRARNAIEIVRQVANGLYEAHCAGIIHRDLKPENIMIEQLPASGFFARILDFGIAQMTEHSGTTHGFRGTPLYSSPEQCMEDPNLDLRSDIYSLGCVFFHCLTGQPPFPYTGALKVMECHVEVEAPSIFEAYPGLKVSEKIDELLARMLAKKVEDRPQDLSKVIDAIDDVLAGRRHLDDSSVSYSVPSADSGSESSAGKETLTEAEAIEAARSTELHAHLVADVMLPQAIADAMQTMILFSLGARGNVCAVADNNNAIHVLSLHGDGFAETFCGARGRLTALHLDLARGSIYGADVDGTILSWNLGVRHEKPRIVGRIDASVMALFRTATGDFLYCGTERGQIITIDMRTQKKKVLVSSGPIVSALSYGPITGCLVAGLWDGGLRTVSLGERVRVKDLSVLKNPVSAVAVNVSERCAALADGQNLAIVDIVEGEVLATLELRIPLRSLVFTTDNRLLGLAYDAMSLQLWDVAHKELGKPSS